MKLADSLGSIESHYSKPLTAEQVPAAKASIARMEESLRTATPQNSCGTALMRISKRLRLAKTQLQRWETDLASKST
jgi:hypothetical protein